jgi:hypothetical protein
LHIHHYATCWNEARVLQFFFRHYQPFISRFFVYDDGSTDGSLDILAAEPDVVVRRRRRSHPDSFVLSGRDHTNNCWKESRGLADWVIIGNIDEHLHHPSLREYLEHCRDKGITVVPALGYQMLSDSFPPAHVKLCGAITRGAPWRQMNKLILFNPDAVREINFDVGRHAARPEGDIRYPERDELLLLHYKYLGRDYTSARHAELRTGLRAVDVANRWGHKYWWSAAELEADWRAMEARAVDIADPELAPWDSHREPRWWRA